MCVYTHICMCVCIHYMYLCVCIYIYVCVSICIYLCVYMYICMCIYVYVNKWFYNILRTVSYSRISRILRMSNTTYITHGSIYVYKYCRITMLYINYILEKHPNKMFYVLVWGPTLDESMSLSSPLCFQHPSW